MKGNWRGELFREFFIKLDQERIYIGQKFRIKITLTAALYPLSENTDSGQLDMQAIRTEKPWHIFFYSN